MAKSNLKAHFGILGLIFYGVGDILGAGIYALVGKVAGISGTFAWMSFSVAMVAAAVTALSYAELSQKFPHSGGVAVYAHEAFRRAWISSLVGWLMFCSCLASMATISKAFFGYLVAVFPGANMLVVILGFFAVLAWVNFRGIKESSFLNIICTSVEATGLLIVLFAASLYLWNSPSADVETVAGPLTEFNWRTLIQGATLSFFAFVGFEDLVNVSEEAKNPTRDIPRAILISLAVAGIFYILISFLSVKVLGVETISASTAPLLDVMNRSFPSFPSVAFLIISLFAVVNTALLNYVTASRLLYGMARERIVPGVLGRVHSKRQTPYVAIFLILPIVLLLALTGALQYLAGTTATLMLAIFVIANLALITIRLRKSTPKTKLQVPLALPIIAIGINIVLILFASAESHRLACILLVIGICLIAVHHWLPKKVGGKFASKNS